MQDPEFDFEKNISKGRRLLTHRAGQPCGYGSEAEWGHVADATRQRLADALSAADATLTDEDADEDEFREAAEELALAISEFECAEVEAIS